jgi:hypothetical protein
MTPSEAEYRARYVPLETDERPYHNIPQPRAEPRRSNPVLRTPTPRRPRQPTVYDDIEELQ